MKNKVIIKKNILFYLLFSHSDEIECWQLPLFT